MRRIVVLALLGTLILAGCSLPEDVTPVAEVAATAAATSAAPAGGASPAATGETVAGGTGTPGATGAANTPAATSAAGTPAGAEVTPAATEGGGTPSGTTPAVTPAGDVESAIDNLTAALNTQIEINGAVTDPNLGGDPDNIKASLTKAAPSQAAVAARLAAVPNDLDPAVLEIVRAAQADVNAIIGLAPRLLSASAEELPPVYEELVFHGGAGLSAMNLALSMLGAGPSAPGSGKLLEDASLQAMEGYEAEIVANGLNFLTAIAVAEEGAVYVSESGFAYGQIRTTPRVLRIKDGGQPEVVAEEGFEGPIAGLEVDGNTLFVSHKGIISTVDLQSGQKKDIITGLPSLGDHYNENIAIGPDDKLYITQGVATNSGVVGPDNYFFGWLPLHPDFADIACRDLTLSGENFVTGNILTDDLTDSVKTGPYKPYGTPAEKGEVIKGQVPCSGAVLRANKDGSGLEVFADGFRNPYGIAFNPDGRLFVTENGPDARGSQPVKGPDNLYEVKEGGWYGWPDFYAGVPVTDPSRKGETGPAPKMLLQDHPPLAGKPFAELDFHSVSNGFDFSRSEEFGHVGHAFITQFGDLTPATAGGAIDQAGQKVIGVTPDGKIHDVLTAGPEGETLFRPTDAQFSPDGNTLYIVHFGEMTAVPGGVRPVPETAALIRITKAAQ